MTHGLRSALPFCILHLDRTFRDVQAGHLPSHLLSSKSPTPSISIPYQSIPTLPRMVARGTANSTRRSRRKGNSFSNLFRPFPPSLTLRQSLQSILSCLHRCPLTEGRWLAQGSRLMAHGSWLMAHGWWLVAGGWWLMTEAWRLPSSTQHHPAAPAPAPAAKQPAASSTLPATARQATTRGHRDSCPGKLPPTLLPITSCPPPAHPPSWFLVLPPQPFSPLRPLCSLRAAKISRLLGASRGASAEHRAQGTGHRAQGTGHRAR